MADIHYKRILLKLSGEALTGSQAFGIEASVIDRIADEIADAYSLGVQIAIVVGGGNFFRGVMGSSWGMDKAAADYVGMLATIMNCLILQGVLNKKGIETRVQTAISMPSVAEPFIRLRAIRHLEKQRVVIFGGGTGNPHVTTDTAAALRGAEIKADAILMAKNSVDGVFDSDPRTNPNAKRLDFISFDDLISQNLKVMDSAAVSLCEQNNIPIIVFDFARPGAIKRLVQGDKIGTMVGSQAPNHNQTHEQKLEPTLSEGFKKKMTTTTEVLANAEERMKKALVNLANELKSVRSGRANPQMLDRVEVECYGTMQPLKGVANISTPDGRSLVVQPYDKTNIKAIEQAIHKSDLGLTPNTDGNIIRISIPTLTEERRKEMTKTVKKIGEESRIAVRNIRRDNDQDLKKLKGSQISEDEIKSKEDALQKITDKYIKEIDKAVHDKEQELLDI